MSKEKKEQQELIEKTIKEVSDTSERIKLVALNHLFKQVHSLTEQMEKEIREVNKKYEELQKPFLEQQQTIIQGRALQQSEVEGVEDYLKEGEKDKVESALQDTSSIPDYWFKSMQNAEVIGNEITQKDQNALKALTKIEFSSSTNEENDQGTWNFRFHFSENDCFTNDVLTKSVIYSLEENRPIRNVGCEINWKEGKNLTKKTVQKKQKNKKSGQQRTVSKEVDDESFFNFFKTIDEIDEEALNNEDLEDDQEIEMMHERNEVDFDIAQVLQEEIVPYSLEYFLDIHGADFEDQEDLSQIEEEDNDTDEDKKKKKKKKMSGSRKGSKEDAKEGQQQQECKQQ